MKNHYLLLFAGLMLFAGCEYDYMDASKTYAIGDTGPGGGIVFYITDNGLHGLEAARSDQSAGHVWIAGGSTQTTLNGHTSTGIGTGYENTMAIIAQSGHTDSAAMVCRGYTGGGKTDWFLPSKDELYLMYVNLYMNGIGGFDIYARYCSSSEYDANNPWSQSFGTGLQEIFLSKGDLFNVRAVRAF